MLESELHRFSVGLGLGLGLDVYLIEELTLMFEAELHRCGAQGLAHKV